MKLTHDEMLQLWKLVNAYEPLRADCTVTRSDGIDLDGLLTVEMQAWYDNLLDTAPIEMLCPHDISSRAILTININGHAEIELPADCRRLIEVKLSCWHRPAAIIAEPDAATINRQSSPFTRGGAMEPVALMLHGRLMLYSIPDGTTSIPRVERLIAVTKPQDGTYELAERAILDIKTHAAIWDT